MRTERIIGSRLILKWVFYLCLLAAVTCMPLKSIRSSAQPASNISLFFLVVFIVFAFAFSKRVSIDLLAGMVTEEILFFSARVLKRRDWPLAEFRAIWFREGWGRRPASIGIRHRSGRILYLREFEAIEYRADFQAEDFVWQLSSDTGLPIDKRVRSIF